MRQKLTGVIHPETVWKLRVISKQLRDKSIPDPSYGDAADSTKDCEDILPGTGRVNEEFGYWVLKAYNYAKTVTHFKTHNTLLDDVIAGKRIYLNSYNRGNHPLIHRSLVFHFFIKCVQIGENMRVQMKLSRITILAMQEYKMLRFNDLQAKVTNGYLVGMAWKAIESNLSEIDWTIVNSATVPNVTDVNGNKKQVTGEQTTLNIETTVLDGIEKLQRDFIDVFGTKKIYKPFVIKCVLLAAILKENGQL